MSTGYSQNELGARGNRTRVTVSTPVVPGVVIYVDRTVWGKTPKAFKNITIVTSFETDIMVFLTCLVEIRVDCFAP